MSRKGGRKGQSGSQMQARNGQDVRKSSPSDDEMSGTAQAYAQILTSHHEGPIPPPQLLEAYERLCPGAAARIMQWAEDDLTHSRVMERSVLETVSRERKRGQICALIACVAAFGAAAYCAHAGAFVAAGVIGGATVVGLVAAFVGARTSRGK